MNTCKEKGNLSLIIRCDAGAVCCASPGPWKDQTWASAAPVKSIDNCILEEVHIQPKNSLRSTVNRQMCCNLAGSVESWEHWFWDTARKRSAFLLFSIVLRIFQLL